MSFFTKVRQVFNSGHAETKDAGGVGMSIITYSEANSVFPRSMAWSDYADSDAVQKSFLAYWNEAYSINPIVYTCVETFAWALAGIPIRVYKSTGQTLKPGDEVQDCPLAELIRNPSEDFGMAQVMYQLGVSYKVSGNAYLYPIGRNKDAWVGKEGEPHLLEVVPPNWMLPVPAADMRHVEFYSYLIPSLTDANVNPNCICHMKTFNPIYPYLGLSPLMAAARSIDISNEGRIWNYKLTKNNASPSGVLSVKAGVPIPPSDSQVEQLRKDVAKNWSGASNASKPVIVPGAFDFQAMSLSPVDMAWRESQKQSAVEICNVMGVPCQMLGIEGSNTYSNYREARRAFYVDTVIPTLKLFLSYMSRHFQKRYGDKNLYLGFHPDDIDALTVDQGAETTRLQNSTWLSVDEKREQMGLKPIGGPQGEARIMPSNSVTLDAVLKPDYKPGSGMGNTPDDPKPEKPEAGIPHAEPLPAGGKS